MTTPRDLLGYWRIEESEGWGRDVLDLVDQAHIAFAEDGTGEFLLVAVEGFLDCRFSEEAGRARVEFSWDGTDEMDPASGRGWAHLAEDGSLEGRIFFHMGDDAAFRAVRTG